MTAATPKGAIRKSVTPAAQKNGDNEKPLRVALGEIGIAQPRHPMPSSKTIAKAFARFVLLPGVMTEKDVAAALDQAYRVRPP